MCGIAGKLHFDTTRSVSPQLIRDMCATIVHRGPDDEGIYTDGPVGLGMRRLSIIDLAGGQQPIANEDQTVWVVFNGEIYNYRELRPGLEAKGHRFATNADTEVIVHLYEEFGEHFAEHLRGMFAIALWDKARETLVLARDRLGKKPLYYAEHEGRLVFGSELKALLVDQIPRDIDPQALHEFLSYNYIPGPRSIFRVAKKLQPGHVLIARRGHLTITPYWQPELSIEPESRTRPVASYVEQLTELLKDSVRYRLISDVPLGVFLSGGVDSSTLVAMMREVSSERIKSFSIGFEDERFNELPYAREIARHFETDHYDLVVKPDALDLLPKLVRFFDEPFADSSAIPVYYLSELARRHVTVALGGDGGDELFAGYETYTAYKMAEFYRRLPQSLQNLVPRLVAKLPVSHGKVSFDYKAKRFIQGALLPPERGHYAWKEVFSGDMKQQLYAFTTAEPRQDPFQVFEREFAACRRYPMLSQLQYVDQRVYLPDDILVKVDRMSMAHSLEVRAPLLDHKLVEFALTIPPELQLKGLKKKYLLKRALEHRLPAKVLSRKKAGFNVPIPGWLRHELRDYVQDVMSERRLREQGFFNPRYVHQLIRDHQDMKVDYSRNLWGLLVFTLWHEAYGVAAQPHKAASSRQHPPMHKEAAA
ncbi:MAG: asparagine synthase (glutamine-hydrolyzing) [Deltaproteobacteria bacterium]|nr:asparagine synthase (glutamine-hydrolyzing) [Deltaproteobacteria bacterium]